MPCCTRPLPRRRAGQGRPRLDWSTSAIRPGRTSTSTALASRTATANRSATQQLPCKSRLRSWGNGSSLRMRSPRYCSRTAVGLDPELLADAVAGVPADALPVVITTWSLSHLSLEHRLRFLHRLDDATSERTVAWVSLEGVGVAPAIPTLGDRRASGHSIIGLALFDHMSLSAGAIGRCWSRGRFLEWLANS